MPASGVCGSARRGGGAAGGIRVTSWAPTSSTSQDGGGSHGDRSWREAIPVNGRGRGWGLDVPSARFRELVPEVTEASSAWNRWYLDAHVAVHGWLTTYEARGENR